METVVSTEADVLISVQEAELRRAVEKANLEEGVATALYDAGYDLDTLRNMDQTQWQSLKVDVPSVQPGRLAKFQTFLRKSSAAAGSSGTPVASVEHILLTLETVTGANGIEKTEWNASLGQEDYDLIVQIRNDIHSYEAVRTCVCDPSNGIIPRVKRSDATVKSVEDHNPPSSSNTGTVNTNQLGPQSTHIDVFGHKQPERAHLLPDSVACALGWIMLLVALSGLHDWWKKWLRENVAGDIRLSKSLQLLCGSRKRRRPEENNEFDTVKLSGVQSHPNNKMYVHNHKPKLDAYATANIVLIPVLTISEAAEWRDKTYELVLLPYNGDSKSAFVETFVTQSDEFPLGRCKTVSGDLMKSKLKIAFTSLAAAMRASYHTYNDCQGKALILEYLDHKKDTAEKYREANAWCKYVGEVVNGQLKISLLNDEVIEQTINALDGDSHGVRICELSLDTSLPDPLLVLFKAVATASTYVSREVDKKSRVEEMRKVLPGCEDNEDNDSEDEDDIFKILEQNALKRKVCSWLQENTTKTGI